LKRFVEDVCSGRYEHCILSAVLNTPAMYTTDKEALY